MEEPAKPVYEKKKPGRKPKPEAEKKLRKQQNNAKYYETHKEKWEVYTHPRLDKDVYNQNKCKFFVEHLDEKSLEYLKTLVNNSNNCKDCSPA